MADTAGMRAIIDLENSNDEVLQTTVDGGLTLLWPLARWPVVRTLAQLDLGTLQPAYRSKSLQQRAIAAARRSVPNPYSASKAPSAEDLFIVSGWTRTPTLNGYRNWLTDELAGALDHAVTIQDAPLDRLMRGARLPLFGSTYSYATDLQSVERTTDRNPLSGAEKRKVRGAIHEIFRLTEFNIPHTMVANATDEILRRVQRVPHARERFARLLDRVNPRRIHMQTAAYGDRAAEIALAHRRGIQVYEPQHGWIGSTHGAYNFGAAAQHAPFADHLPDTLLTFGESWSAAVRFPGRTVAIGKPDLLRSLAVAPPFEHRERRVLFVSSNTNHDHACTLLLRLRDALGDGWTIAVRPHPVERAHAERNFARLMREPGFELDTSADSATAMSRARGILGYSSTMLYEGIAYRAHVGVIDSSFSDHYAPKEVFPLRIVDAASIASAARVFSSGAPIAGSDSEVWAPDPIRRFRKEVYRS